MVDSMRSSLPPSCSKLFGPFFDRPKVVEKRATCERCSMCDHGEPSPVPIDYFNPSVKCCTFWPLLPNYLVGAILADDAPDMETGKARIKRAIAKRIGVAPLFMSRPRKMTLLMKGYDAFAFGRAESMKCPYYDDDHPDAACSIWRHRDAVCMTYFCMHSGGTRAIDYWNALKAYLHFVECRLAEAAAMAVDRRVVEPRYPDDILTVEDMEDLPPKDSDYRSWWGQWVGREEEFYLKCHEWVESVTPQGFAENIDQSAEGKQLLDKVIASYELLQNRIVPNRLVRDEGARKVDVGDKLVVIPSRRRDSISVDKKVFEVVGTFKADRTLDENRQCVQREKGVELAPDLIHELFAGGVLVEPSAANVDVTRTSAEDQGRQRGLRAALYAALEGRGFVCDDSAKAKIDAGDVAKLALWIKRGAVAKTIDEVLTD